MAFTRTSIYICKTNEMNKYKLKSLCWCNEWINEWMCVLITSKIVCFLNLISFHHFTMFFFFVSFSEPMFSSKSNKQRTTSTSSTMTTESYCISIGVGVCILCTIYVRFRIDKNIIFIFSASVVVLMSITTDQITIGRHS